jgi:hypothetical protein
MAEEKWRERIPYIALGLSLTTLLFQIFVLHAWHMKLSDQMKIILSKV